MTYLENYDLVLYRENGMMGLMTIDQKDIYPATIKGIELDIDGDYGLLLTDFPNGKAGYIDNKGKEYFYD
ncbi:hypothetical protein AB9P05_07575 [Roseivirga sp. BDSF3-8]|uniref:hypothetical protein n=1 Tax=Roseivirga sp. BDSF3-8 TaxID=3241598 RepID=UPI00353187E9